MKRFDTVVSASGRLAQSIVIFTDDAIVTRWAQTRITVGRKRIIGTITSVQTRSKNIAGCGGDIAFGPDVVSVSTCCWNEDGQFL